MRVHPDHEESLRGSMQANPAIMPQLVRSPNPSPRRIVAPSILGIPCTASMPRSSTQAGQGRQDRLTRSRRWANVALAKCRLSSARSRSTSVGSPPANACHVCSVANDSSTCHCPEHDKGTSGRAGARQGPKGTNTTHPKSARSCTVLLRPPRPKTTMARVDRATRTLQRGGLLSRPRLRVNQVVGR